MRMTIEDLEHASVRNRVRDAGNALAVDCAPRGLDGTDRHDVDDRTGPVRRADTTFPTPAARPARG